jgi:hypothetical protein
MINTALGLVKGITCFCQSDCNNIVAEMTRIHGGAWGCAAGKGAHYWNIPRMAGFIQTETRNWYYDIYHWN